MLKRTLIVAIAASLPLVTGCADAPRQMTDDPVTGFAIYRSGRLSSAELDALCALGVEEILVLDGEGGRRECAWRETACPKMVVRYDHAQEADQPVTLEFLEAFDSWIEEARAQGKKIAFRCRHGWHRTGRLAAYYRMRFEGASVAEATGEMQRVGRMMWLHPTLDPQVEAYADFVAGRPCSSDVVDCPLSKPDPGLVDGRFSEDVCGASF